MLFSEPKIPQSRRTSAGHAAREVSVLFSEPKIPQSDADCVSSTDVAFQCSSASRKFLNPQAPVGLAVRGEFQCSSASRKFLNIDWLHLSVFCTYSFSALQRAENSSMFLQARRGRRVVWFQCSSASRKFLNHTNSVGRARPCMFQCSSASRKFLNDPAQLRTGRHRLFQCSSASRKFLNHYLHCATAQLSPFQCSSASRKFLNLSRAKRESERVWVSVLFSEPKIPQSNVNGSIIALSACVSVLFSEPKIPQYRSDTACTRGLKGFSALQRAENSSMRICRTTLSSSARFQCSSASRKFLNLSVLLLSAPSALFQCSSASRKFLNKPPKIPDFGAFCVSVLFSEPKIPQFRRSVLG